MEIKINDEQLKSALSEALLLSIPEETRQEMIKQSISNLVAPQKGSYGKQEPSIIQEVYDRAIRLAVEEMVRDEIQKMSELKDEVLKLISPYRHTDYKRHEVILTAIVESLLDYHSR